MKNWYKVTVYRAHTGNKIHCTTAYIYAENINEILDRYNTMPGVKRNLNNSKPFPDITKLLNDKEPKKLLKKAGISEERAKKTWIYEEYI